MALFWFLYIIFLYKICRCYFKDKWRKEEEKFLQARYKFKFTSVTKSLRKDNLQRFIFIRKKRLMAIRNGHCLSASEKTDQVLGQIDQNEIRQDSGERKDKDQKELKVAFNLPEEKEEKHENYNELVIPSSKIETEIPKIDFVEYI